MDNARTHMVPTDALDESRLSISLSQAGPTKEVTVVRIDGVVDTMTAGELERVIAALLGSDKYRLVMDLAGVEYISSAGWGIFVSRLREIREHAGDIKLARMTPDVCEIYELLEFDGLLPHYDSLEAAESAFYHGGSTSPPPPKQSITITQRPTEEMTAAKPAGELSLDEAVIQLVAEDPFYTIADLRDQINQQYPDRYNAGWWNIFAGLRRARLLSRRARFRLFRQQRSAAR